MAIHSLERTSDPRVVCGLLAREALKELNQEEREEGAYNSFLLNLKRVLEMYRYDTFLVHDKRGVLNRGTSSTIASQRRTQREHMNSVKAALQAAHENVFRDKTRDEVVEIIVNVLEAANEKRLKELDPREIVQAQTFLSDLANHLRD